MSPTVSAVIPAFNSQDYLEEAVSSVLSQTYGSVECIVVDDGSTDATPDVARSFGNHVQVLSQPNLGVAAARNRGVGASDGEFIAFLDADDVWFRTKLQRQMDLINSSGAEFCYTGMYRTDHRLRVLEPMPPPSPIKARWNTLTMTQPTVFLAQTGLIRRKLLMKLGGFDERLSVAADYDLAVRATSRCVVECIDAPLAFYRIHDGQMHRNVVELEKDVLTSLSGLVADDFIGEKVSLEVQRILAFGLGIHALSEGDWAVSRGHFGKVGSHWPGLAARYFRNRLAGRLGHARNR